MINDKIAIVTPSYTKELYEKTSTLFPVYFTRYVVDGKKGLFGLDFIMFIYSKLRRKSIKWLVLIDEDVVLFRSQSLLELINHMEDLEYKFCGMREGGSHSGRLHNPFVVNTYFAIIDFEWSKSIWKKADVIANQYTIKDEFDDDLSQLDYEWNPDSLFEAYYCFFLWMRRKGGKGLFLKSKHLSGDPFSNILYDHNNREFLLHTWYSRRYNQEIEQRIRIDRQLSRFMFTDNPRSMPQKLNSTSHNLRMISKRLAEKIGIRI